MKRRTDVRDTCVSCGICPKKRQATVIEKIMNIVRIRKDERMLCIIATVFFTALNVLNICRYWEKFTQLSDNFHKLFVRSYYVSGFDPLSYEVMSSWDTVYNVFRHPLLAFLMYPFYLLNQGLIWLTGVNCTIVIMAVILVTCSVYSCIFLYRILREIVGVTAVQAHSLCAFCFSFAFIMLSTMVPDHFVMSMCMLLLTLYLAGKRMKKGEMLSKCETIMMFVVTAGISLNNGLKVFLAALFAGKKKIFRPGYMLLSIILPAALMWGFAQWEYKTYVWPKEMARKEAKKKKDKVLTEGIRTHVIDSLKKANVPLVTAKDSQAITAAVNKERQARAVAKAKRDKKHVSNRHTGTPIAKEGFMKWTDISTSRWDTAVENLFGEGIILHEDHLLCDVLRNRPVIVRYKMWGNYIIEGIIVLLFATGIWYGRKQRFLWLAMSFFLMDMLLHVGLGFGINEIYIMSPHYLFVIPIAAGYLLKENDDKIVWRGTGILTILTALLAVYCLAWNISMIVGYMV